MTDLSEHLGQEQTKQVQEIISNMDFEKCPTGGKDMKRVYTYIISCLAFMVESTKNGEGEEGELKLLGGKLLSMKGIHITGRDVVLLGVIAAIVMVVIKDIFLK